MVLEWAEGIFGVWSTLFSLLVALSALGTVVASGFCGMRQLVCVAREGKAQMYSGNFGYELITEIP